MHSIISLLLEDLIIDDKSLGVMDYIINILFFITIIKTNILSYSEYIDICSQKNLINYQFKIIILNENSFNYLLELFNSNTFNILKDKSIIDIIYTVLCDNKKYKYYVKEFDLYFTNRAYIKEIFDLRINVKARIPANFES